MPEPISIVTDEISQDLGVCREFLDTHDLHAVELRCVGGQRVPDMAPADRAELVRWARQGDPGILSVSPGLFKCDRDDRETTRRHLDDVLPRSLELAQQLGARFLVAFTFENPTGRPLDQAATDVFRAAADRCRTAGVDLLIENEPGFLASTPDQIVDLLDAVDHPHVAVNWDPLNSNVFETQALNAGLERIFPHVRHVHVKNGRLAPGELLARCCPLRDGAIDWAAHLAKLHALGYEGYLGVETHFEPFAENSVIVLGEVRALARAAGFPHIRS